MSGILVCQYYPKIEGSLATIRESSSRRSWVPDYHHDTTNSLQILPGSTSRTPAPITPTTNPTIRTYIPAFTMTDPARCLPTFSTHYTLCILIVHAGSTSDWPTDPDINGSARLQFRGASANDLIAELGSKRNEFQPHGNVAAYVTL